MKTRYERAEAIKNYQAKKNKKDGGSCATCDGTGKVSGKECTECSGSGYEMSNAKNDLGKIALELEKQYRDKKLKGTKDGQAWLNHNYPGLSTEDKQDIWDDVNVGLNMYE